GRRCRSCGVSISARYPLVEASAGLLAVLALVRFGPTPEAAVAFAFTAALLLITFIDLDHRFIPDEVSLPGILVGLAVAFLPGGVTPASAVVGAALGGGVLWVVAWVYERATGVEGMGLGDVNMLARGSGGKGRRVRRRLGLRALPAFMQRAARRTEIPFGPFLALGALVVLYVP